MDFYLKKADDKLKKERQQRDKQRKSDAARKRKVAAEAARMTAEMEQRLAQARAEEQLRQDEAAQLQMENELLTGGVEYGEILRCTEQAAVRGHQPWNPRRQHIAAAAAVAGTPRLSCAGPGRGQSDAAGDSSGDPDRERRVAPLPPATLSTLPLPLSFFSHSVCEAGEGDQMTL